MPQGLLDLGSATSHDVIFFKHCYSMGRSDIRDIHISRVVGIAAVKSHEAKPSAISPLYQKRVEYIPEFHDCPCYNVLIPWLHNGGAISFFHVGR